MRCERAGVAGGGDRGGGGDLASRQRNRGQLLQLAVLLPTAPWWLQWLLLQLAGPAGGMMADCQLAAQLLSEALLMGGLVMAGVLLAPLVESFFGLLDASAPAGAGRSGAAPAAAALLRGARHL